MAKTKISEWSTTPASNTDIDGINIAEGCAPSGINDAIRDLMAQVRSWQSGASGDPFNGPMNGTIGATTAYSGAFTTLSASGTTTLSGLTASTALALDASKNVVSVANTGSGSNVLATSPTLVTPALGTPSSATLTNATGLPISTGVSGLGTGVATALAVNVGSAGAPVVNGGALGTPSSGTVTNLTGTASININGTVGATTPTTGAFTTTTVSTSETLSYGTANGVTYLNGSKVLTSGSALTFDGTNFVVNNGYIRANNTIGYYTNLTATGLTNYATSMDFNSVASHIFSINSSEIFRTTSTSLYTASGINVGIGTSSPTGYLANKLVIATGTDSNNGITIASASNRNGSIWFADGTTGNQSYRGGIDYQHTTDTLYLYSGAQGNFILDSAGNLGLGVTPSAWGGTGVSAFQISGYGSFAGSVGSVDIYNNAYYDGSVFKYISSNPATRYSQNTSASSHAWYNAASGTAGNTISFTQAMTLDASARLGIKQTSPTVDLDVGANDNTVAALSVRYSTVPAYLSNSYDGSVGLTTLSANSFNTSSGSASWSAFQNTGYGNAAVQIAAGTYGSDIRFLTAAAANTNPTERAKITSDGNLLVGTTIMPNSTTAGMGYNPTSTFLSLSCGSTTTSVTQVYFTNGNGTVGSISTNGSATAYNTSSDYRLKNITGALTGYKERLMSLLPKQGTWIADGSEFRGFVAHDFANPYPKSVTGEKDAVDENGNPVMQAMQASSSEVMADLVAMVKDLITENESLKARLDAANL